MNFKPLGSNILARRIKPRRLRSGPIILADADNDRVNPKSQMAVVVAVGPGRRNAKGVREQVGVNPGEQVMTKFYAGTDITLDGEEFVILKPEEIVAAVEA
jgi:chaperonin GroES